MSRGRVEFDHVWKKFRRGTLHDSLRDLLPALARRGVRRSPALREQEFWALRDVSFEVVPGQALGIIGPNGAGKSTVLKLLTRILRPTRGRARLVGRVGALIEIAAGFHADLTGRENVYLQGAMMGMRREEIARQFDAIVAFAELGEFIDTQVKRYSSGMNARLGFAIAAHLDPEVLIIDEVLAVGDFSFQRKAFGRIAEMTRREIPVVIVSHQLDRIASLCSDAILLERGRVRCTGKPEEVIARYVSGVLGAQGEPSDDAPLVLEGIERSSDGPIRSGERFEIRVFGRTLRPLPEHVTPRVRVQSVQRGETLFGVYGASAGIVLPDCGDFELRVELQANVPGGFYTVEAGLLDLRRKVELPGAAHLVVRVEQSDDFRGLVHMHPRIEVLSGAPKRRSLP